MTYCILFLLLLIGTASSALTPGDTIVYKKPRVPNAKDKIFVPPLVLKTSPTAILWGGCFPFTSEYRLMAEITSGKRQSEQAAISVLGKNLFLKALEKAANYPTSYIFKVSGWRIQYAHKFYLVGRRRYAPYGFYFGPLVSYANAHVSLGLNRYYKQVYWDLRNFNANMIFGVQAGKMDRLTLDIYGGAGYKNNKLFYHTSTLTYIPLDSKDMGDLYNSHLNLVFGVNLGYSF